MAGGLWAAVAGFLKVYREVQEVISTICSTILPFTLWAALLMVNHYKNPPSIISSKRIDSSLLAGSVIKNSISSWCADYSYLGCVILVDLDVYYHWLSSTGCWPESVNVTGRRINVSNRYQFLLAFPTGRHEYARSWFHWSRSCLPA